MIRVGIIADTNTQRQTLAALIADENRIELVDLSPFIQSFRENPLTDIDVLVTTSFALVRSAPVAGPPVIVVGQESNTALQLRDPVRAWLPGNPNHSELSAAICAVAQNLVVLTNSQANRLVNQAKQNEREEFAGEALTPRELEVLHMLVDGLGNKEIAKSLRISNHTAKFHVGQILAKLGAGSRAEAVAIGMRTGLVPV